MALDLSLIVAGTKYRGQFEEHLKTIMKELMESQNSIIFIDELHTLVGAGSAEGSLDAANILKPAFSRGEIQCIVRPHRRIPQINREGSLARTSLPGCESSAAQRGRCSESAVRNKGPLEKFHAVTYTDDAINFAVSTRIAIFRTVSFRIRPSISSTKQERA